MARPAAAAARVMGTGMIVKPRFVLIGASMVGRAARQSRPSIECRHPASQGNAARRRAVRGLDACGLDAPRALMGSSHQGAPMKTRLSAADWVPLLVRRNPLRQWNEKEWWFSYAWDA